MFDMHTHFIPPNVLTWLRDHKHTLHAKWEKKSLNQSEFLTINHKWSFELKDAFINPALYLHEQEKAHVSHSLVSPIPQLFLYDLPDQLTAELSDLYNHSLACWVKEEESHLWGLATLPMNNPVQAAKELEKAMNAGLKGAIIGTGRPDTMLTNVIFTPFWEAANHQHAILFIHPLLSEDPRLRQRMMPNLIGVPWETTVCATDLLLSGILDKYPNVRILLAHGGGFLPYQIGRLNKGYEKWPGVSRNLQASPTEYLRRFWYDSVLWNEASLDFLRETVGEDRIVPGSDFPFDLSSWPPVSMSPIAVHTLLNLPIENHY